MYSDHTIFSRSTSEFLTPPRRPVYEQEYQLEYPEPEFTIIDSPWSSSSSSSLPDQSSSYPLASLQTALTPEILDTAPAPGYIYGPDETYDPTLEHVFQALMRDAEASLSFSPSDYPPSSPPNGIDPSKISQPSFPSPEPIIFDESIWDSKPSRRAKMSDTQDRPYNCTHCSASFARAHDLRRHTRSHTGERPYVCYGGCGLAFKRPDARQRHWNRQELCATVHVACTAHTLEGQRRARKMEQKQEMHDAMWHKTQTMGGGRGHERGQKRRARGIDASGLSLY